MFDSTLGRRSLDRLAVPAGVVAALAVMTGTAQAQSFPANDKWTALTRDNGAVLDDPKDDSHSDHREIVGEGVTSAYVASDGTYFYVRVRLDATPVMGTTTQTLKSFGWGVLIDINNDLKDYEYSLILNGTGATPMITFGKNTAPTMAGDPSVQATVITEVPVVLGTNVVVTASDYPTTTMFNGTDDFFLSYAFPWATLSAAGLQPSDTIRVFVGTSNNGRSLTADLVAPSGITTATPMALEQPGVASDPVVPGATSDDSDGDGLPNSVEDANGNGVVDPGETDPHDGDSDDDGLADGTEDADHDGTVDPDETDPTSDDTDGDGLSDGTEDPNHDGTVDEGETDATNDDSDGDGLSDGTEDANHDGSVSPGETDPTDHDTDDGGVSDGDEVKNGTNPLDPSDDQEAPDDDGDGVGNGADNCPSIANPDQADLDNDGTGDACEGGGGFTVQGGAGCSTTGSSGLGTLFLLAAAVALVMGRRRGAAMLVVSSVPISAAPRLASAQDATNFSVERFRLSTNRAGLFDVEWAELDAPRTWDIGLALGFADDPLIVSTSDGMQTSALVDHRLGGNLVGAFVATRWLELGLDMPLILSQTGQPSMQVGTGSVDSFALGDLRFAPKLQLLRASRHGIGLTVIPAVTLPTATTSDYAGEKTVTFQPEVAVAKPLGAFRLGVNTGLRVRENVRLADLAVGDELFLRIGGGYRFDHDGSGMPLELGVTTSLATATSNFLGRKNVDSWELFGGGQYDVRKNVLAFAGAGFGLTHGFGTPDFRVLIGTKFHFEPGKAGRAYHEHIASNPPPPQPGDRDGDGLLDDADRCPEQPEDVDMFEDDDGCPDPDNDADGVADFDDKCPLEPGVASAAGCTEPDRDHDTVIDRVDNCPDEPGDPANAGCKQKQQVQITGGKLEIIDIVYFETNKSIILAKSNSLLDNVAKVLSAHPEITKVRVEGHTDNRGSAAWNKQLSQHRAEAVVAYLVKKGVAKERLEAAGYGPDRPIAPNDTKENQAKNRRVEFVIVGGAAGIQQQRTGPGSETMDRPAR